MIDGFIEAATCRQRDSDADCPALALKVTAGLGKTSTALRKIARHAEPLLARGHVLVYMPTLELAERALTEFRQLAPAVPSRVLRGREALRPDHLTEKMCKRSDLVKTISGFVPSVTQALCRSNDPDGNLVQSHCAGGCPYLGQRDIKGAHVTFLSHAYLTVRPPVDDDMKVALRVIDEKVWPILANISCLPIGEFLRPPSEAYPAKLRSSLSIAQAAIIDGLHRGLPLHSHVRDMGITDSQLEGLPEAESGCRESLDIRPWQSEHTIRFRVDTFDRKAFIASRRRQKVFERLSEKPVGHCCGLAIVETPAAPDAQLAIEFSSMEKIPRDAPVLLLDADADPDITERIAPGAEFLEIQSPPVADIVQVSDLTLSNSWLLHPDHGSTRRAGVLTILRREVEAAAGGGVLIVATKSVLRALHADLGMSDTSTDDALRQPLLGAVPRWFGPRTQGVNDFENYAAIVVVGRLQPRAADVEAAARAVFAADELPILAHCQGPLPKCDTHTLMADGTEVTSTVNTHPDPRVHAVMAQIRECGSLQAIARLRLVTPQGAKRVVILSNVPLPKLPITRLATFEALERGLEHEPDVRGFLRLETALRATGDLPVRGSRLSALGLATDLPRDFRSDDVARNFRRGRTTNHLMDLCARVAKANGWPLTPLALRRPEGGKAVPAIIIAPRQAALAQAESFWPGFAPNFF